MRRTPYVLVPLSVDSLLLPYSLINHSLTFMCSLSFSEILDASSWAWISFTVPSAPPYVHVHTVCRKEVKNKNTTFKCTTAHGPHVHTFFFLFLDGLLTSSCNRATRLLSCWFLNSRDSFSCTCFLRFT